MIFRYFIETLRERNESLFLFGGFCFALALLFILLSKTTSIEVMGANAWNKPLKFALSIGIFSWTMGWYGFYLNEPRIMAAYNWGVVILLGFELIYIAIQAGRGQLSHYNNSNWIYSNLYVLMALAAAGITLWTGYLGVLFFQKDFPSLPDHYVWAIRIGIILFVIFSLEGFAMGSQRAHTIGTPDGGPGLNFLNWSITHGDLRIAHFVGMHALQALPLLSFFLFKNTKLTLASGLLYGFLAFFVLFQALQGRPFLKF